MKKWVKVTLWTLGSLVVIAGGLMGIGYSMHKKAERLVHNQGGFTKVRVVSSSDKVLCPGPATGLIVGTYDTEKAKYFPICTPLFGEATLGKWAD